MGKYQELIEMAMEARKLAYAPYSHFQVGAALLAEDETVYQGCNIENASYPAGHCAERTAFSNAVVHGMRKFVAIAIVGGAEGVSELEYCAPCGICRQMMREFCEPDRFEIVLARTRDDYKVYTLQELLPESFGPQNLK